MASAGANKDLLNGACYLQCYPNVLRACSLQRELSNESGWGVLQGTGLTVQDVQFIMHPGGPKILHGPAEIMGVGNEKFQVGLPLSLK